MGFVHSYEQVIPLQARIFTLPPLYWPQRHPEYPSLSGTEAVLFR